MRRNKPMLLRWVTRITVNRPPPGSIPLSPPASLKNDYYSLLLSSEDGTWSFNVRGLEKGALSGWRFDSSRPGERGQDASISNADTKNCRFQFTHYYRGYRFNYDNKIKTLIHHYARFYAIYRLYDSVVQYFYNKRKFTNKDRYQLLKYMLEKSIINEDSTSSIFVIVNDLYGNRWILHPDQSRILNYYGIVMDSLVDSGDVTKDRNGSFRITGHGLTTIWQFEDSLRKHQDNVRQQTILGILTFVLVIVGVGQLAVEALDYFRPKINAASTELVNGTALSTSRNQRQ